MDKNIRPVVQWLGSPDPSAQIATVLSSTRGAEDPRGPTTSAEKPSLQGYYPYSAAGSHGEENRQQDGRDGDVILGLAEGRELNEMGLPSSLSAGETPIKVPAYVCGEWEWGLGLGPEERKRVIFKQGDMLWKSVPGNLAKSTAWFVEEVGLSWDAMRKVMDSWIVRHGVEGGYIGITVWASARSKRTPPPKKNESWWVIIHA